jgi:hypothetical protein
MLVIDDKELLGKEQHLERQFLRLDQLTLACEILNEIAYRVF